MNVYTIFAIGFGSGIVFTMLFWFLVAWLWDSES